MRKIAFEEIYNEINGDWGYPSSIKLDDYANNYLDGMSKAFCHMQEPSIQLGARDFNTANLEDFLWHSKWLFELTNKIKTLDEILLEKLQGKNNG
jgi:hypothetical protein